VYFTAWPFSKHQVLHWPVARADDGKNRFITCTADDKLNPLIFKPFRLFALQTLEEQFAGVLQEDFIVSASPGKGAK